MMLPLLTVWACTSAFAPRATRNTLTRRQFTEIPEALETARFVRVDPECTDDKPVLLALGGLDGSPRVGATNWKRLSEWFDVRALVWTVWKSTSVSAMSRAVRNRHRYAIEQASHRWRGGRREDQHERAVNF